MLQGPLAGLRVVEFVGIGPGPHCAMLLADLGAQIVRIDRAGGNGWPNPVVDRGRSTVEVDIRSDKGKQFCRSAVGAADVLIEGYRPGVMERLGLGPDEMAALNPRLVYGRITGWGQNGPLATAAGHDINYIALAGALAAIGRPGEPAVPPLNLVGDFGGGSMFLVFGILAALLERERSGLGQVVDAAIIDGVGSLMAMFAQSPQGQGVPLDRAINPLSGAAPYYRCYRCACGHEISIGPIEEHFFAELLTRIDAPASFAEVARDAATWPSLSDQLAAIFMTRTVDEWCLLLEGSDACFAPVISLGEVPRHPHMQARQSHVELDGLTQVSPAPRFSRTPGVARSSSANGHDVVAEWLKTTG